MKPEMADKMKILVTGGAGYIGSHTCVELLQRGFGIVVVDNLSNSREQSLDRVRQITGKDFPFFKADIRDRPALDAIFAAHRFSCVIHFAGMKAVGESVAKPLEYYDANLGSTIALCQTMKAHGIRRIVFSSSATVYAPGNAMPLDETSRTGGCTNPYAWTKYMSERILADTAAADPAFSVVLLRYFNPVGAHPSGLIGEDPCGIPNNLMPFVSQVAVGRLDHLDVFGNDYPTPDGTGVRDFIHVCDLAAGHAAAIGYAAGHPGVHAFNLGTGKGTSVLELVRAFERASGKTIPYEFKPRRTGDLPAVYADPRKSERLLGWKARLDLDAMCCDAWNWQSKNPMGYQAT